MALMYYGVSAQGGFLSVAKLSQEVRFKASNACVFRQFVRIQEDYGKFQGQSIYFDKVSKVQTAGARLSELTPIPKTRQTIYQGSLTAYEYGNAIAYTGFLASMNQLAIQDIAVHGLVTDMAEVLDAQAAAAFQATDYYYTPTGTQANPTGTFATGGVAGAAATRNIQAYDVRQIRLRMKILNIPSYDGQNYMCLMSPTAADGITADTEYKNDARWGDPQRLFTGEIARWHGTRFVEETNSLSNNVATTGLGECIFFGGDPVVEGIAVAEELRAERPADFGRSQAIAWYFIGGWSKTWDYSSETEERIIRVHST